MKEPLKILVECHHGIGDIVMTLPALKKLHRSFPQAVIHMLIGKTVENEIIDMLGFVEKTYSYDISKDGLLQLVRLSWHISKEKYDLGLALGQSPKGLDALLLKLSGCKRVIGIKINKPILRCYEMVDVSGFNHRTEQHMACIEYLDQKHEEIDYKTLQITERNKIRIKNQIGIDNDSKIIGLCLGSGDFFYKSSSGKIWFNAKNWDLRNFIALARKCNSNGYRVILFGGEAEHELGEKLQAECQCINLIGKSHLYDTIKYLSVCNIVIGNDTGLMHCAAAIGTDTVTLFGPTDSSKIGPYGDKANYIRGKCECLPCYGESERVYTCADRKCLKNLKIETVVNAIECIGRGSGWD